MSGQRILAKLLVDLRSRNRDRESLLNFRYDACAVKPNREVALVIATRSVAQLLATCCGSGSVRRAQRPYRVFAMRVPKGQPVKVGGCPRRRRGEQTGGQQKYYGGQSHKHRHAFSAERKPLRLSSSLRQAHAMRGVLCANPTRPRRSSRIIPPWPLRRWCRY